MHEMLEERNVAAPFPRAWNGKEEIWDTNTTVQGHGKRDDGESQRAARRSHMIYLIRYPLC
jgi:hypothetical protein